MAKRKAARQAKSASSTSRSKPARRLVKRPIKKSAPRVRSRKRAAPKRSKTVATKAAPKGAPRAARPDIRKRPQLDRERRRLEETVQTPPSSLNLNRHGSAARTGRAEMAERRHDLQGMNEVTGGDPDADAQDAYFTGDEAPGGDNPTPDQDIVDDIGKALGVEYQDNEELKASDKVIERDKHRWELDPASAEDYKDRK